MTRSRVIVGAALIGLAVLTVSLHDALGTRDVLDGSGKPVRDFGVYELPGRPSP